MLYMETEPQKLIYFTYESYLKRRAFFWHIALINQKIVHFTSLNSYHFFLPMYIDTLHLETIGR